jgi:hypothetical protein
MKKSVRPSWGKAADPSGSQAADSDWLPVRDPHHGQEPLKRSIQQAEDTSAVSTLFISLPTQNHKGESLT